MLLSMTGYGDARRQNDRLSVVADVRAVNNRYFKVTTKCPDVYGRLENAIEKTVRGTISRGTVSVTLRVDRLTGDSDGQIDVSALSAYWNQAAKLAGQLGAEPPTRLDAFLLLPGIVEETTSDPVSSESDWPLIEETLQAALTKLQEFRVSEGASMEADLRRQCEVVSAQLEHVAEAAPGVVSAFRDRLQSRVSELLTDHEASVNPSDLIREVSIFAEKSDINEELTRLQSHVEQFLAVLGDETSQGRKLEFLTQEMFREVNTIGSKANDVAIAHRVVEAKSAIEKMREILQNVE